MINIEKIKILYGTGIFARQESILQTLSFIWFPQSSTYIYRIFDVLIICYTIYTADKKGTRTVYVRHTCAIKLLDILRIMFGKILGKWMI